jgi:hypothetical protein
MSEIRRTRKRLQRTVEEYRVGDNEGSANPAKG